MDSFHPKNTVGHRTINVFLLASTVLPDGTKAPTSSMLRSDNTHRRYRNKYCFYDRLLASHLKEMRRRIHRWSSSHKFKGYSRPIELYLVRWTVPTMSIAFNFLSSPNMIASRLLSPRRPCVMISRYSSRHPSPLRIGDKKWSQREKVEEIATASVFYAEQFRYIAPVIIIYRKIRSDDVCKVNTNQAPLRFDIDSSGCK